MPKMAPSITRETFVGREKELRTIQEVIEKPGMQVINIQGEGGIGKTSLLTKVKELYEGNEDFYVSGILDFFHTASRTPEGFQEMLRAQEDFPEASFEDWSEAWEKYNRFRLAGLPGKDVEEQREKAEKAFRADFIRLTEEREPILLIDTFELVQDAMGPWLLDFLAHLIQAAEETHGATFIIAGRRNEEWQVELENRIPEQNAYIELTAFEEAAIEELFDQAMREVPEEKPEAQAEREKLALLTGRHPLLVAMALDWRNLTEIPLGHLTPTTETHTLTDLQQMSQYALDDVREQFEAELMEKFRDLKDPTDQTILEMAYVYKRFDADILAYLEDIPKEEAEARLADMAWWCFMKYDERTDTYQLHDKMRDMVIEHIWASLDVDGSIRSDYAGHMTVYYERLLENLDRQIAQKITEYRQAELRGELEAQAAVKREEIDLRAERNELDAHYVYYDILAHPNEGLMHCNEAITNDIWAFNREGYTLKQREREDALQALGQEVPPYLTKLEKARVLTIIEEDQASALRLLGELDNQELLMRHEMERSTFPAKVKNYQSLNVYYLPPLSEAPSDIHDVVKKWVGAASPSERAIEIAQEAIDILEELRKTTLNERNKRSVHRSLARAYQAQAYPLSRLGRLQKAIKAYQSCQSYARLGDLPATRSHALNDLAYIYARLGRFSLAIRRAQEGLEIRERLGLDYFVGLSYNTLGVIHFLDDKPYQARIRSEQALHIFESLDDKRGIGLANFTLGKINVRIGEIEVEEGYLEEAEKNLKEAESIFSSRDEQGQLVEPSRLPQVYERLAILYMVWGGNLLAKLGEDPRAHLGQAKLYFDKAIRGYEAQDNKWEQCIALERCARVDFDRGLLYTEEGAQERYFQQAEEKLDQAEDIVHEQAHDMLLQPIEESEDQGDRAPTHPEYGLALGKIEMGRGRITFERLKFNSLLEEERARLLGEAARHFALSCAYLERFSPVARELEASLALVDEHTRSLEYLELTSFQQDVLETQKTYGVQVYRRLPDYLKDIASFERI